MIAILQLLSDLMWFACRGDAVTGSCCRNRFMTGAFAERAWFGA